MGRQGIVCLSVYLVQESTEAQHVEPELTANPILHWGHTGQWIGVRAAVRVNGALPAACLGLHASLCQRRWATLAKAAVCRV